jgi:hypothetical protein
MKEQINRLFGVIVRGPDNGRYYQDPITGKFVSVKD